MSEQRSVVPNVEVRAFGNGFEPLSVRIQAAVQLTGISRSRLYELIQSGDLETVKVGRSTLIPYRSLKALTRG